MNFRIIEGLSAFLEFLVCELYVNKMEALKKLSDSIIQNTTEGVTVTDSEGNIIKVNQAFTCITGYSEEEAIEKNPRILKSDRHGNIFYKEMWDSLLHTGT